MDRADRDAIAAQIGTAAWQRRTAQQQRNLHQGLHRLAEEIDAGRRPISAYLEAAKHLFAARTAVIETLADEQVGVNWEISC